jgi:transposase-like protein
MSGPPCPKCKSQSTELAQVKAKKVSGGKIAAGIMTGGLSLLATGVKSKQKVDWVCRVCGNSFTVKS